MKIVIAVIAGTALLIGLAVRAQDTPAARLLTDAEVQQYYNGLNDEYFGGQLPAAHVHFVENLQLNEEPLMGLTSETAENTEVDISLAAKYRDNPSVTLEVLVHESCHVAVAASGHVDVDEHGPYWTSCMVHMAEAGAFRGIWIL